MFWHLECVGTAMSHSGVLSSSSFSVATKFAKPKCPLVSCSSYNTNHSYRFHAHLCTYTCTYVCSKLIGSSIQTMYIMCLVSVHIPSASCWVLISATEHSGVTGSTSNNVWHWRYQAQVFRTTYIYGRLKCAKGSSSLYAWTQGPCLQIQHVAKSCVSGQLHCFCGSRLTVWRSSKSGCLTHCADFVHAYL